MRSKSFLVQLMIHITKCYSQLDVLASDFATFLSKDQSYFQTGGSDAQQFSTKVREPLDTTTNPLLADTDGGGFTDGQEDKNANGRVDAGERDAAAKNMRTMPWIPLLLGD